MQELKRHYSEKEYTMTLHTIEFSPTSDGAEPHIELNIQEPQETGWKIDIVGSKQVNLTDLT